MRKYILVLARTATVFFSFYSGNAMAQKGLANPFGGHPPESSMDEDENGRFPTDYITFKGRNGSFEHKYVWAVFSNNRGIFDGPHAHNGVLHRESKEKRIYCYSDIKVMRLNNGTGFNIHVGPGSCWKYKNNDYNSYRNIGGANTPTLNCYWNGISKSIAECRMRIENDIIKIELNRIE